MPKTKLFCVPFAGGSAANFVTWKKYLHSSVELKPVELSGRGKRLNEPLYEKVTEAVEDIFQRIRFELNDNRYAFFGHSLGAILIYELIYKIKQAGFPDPVHVFFSGRYPPHIKKDEFNLYHLPDEEFSAAILKLGGTSQELFEHKELRNIFLPILKADHKIHDTYEYVAQGWKYDFDITVFNGRDDHEITGDDLREWANYTNRKCHIYEFDGGHFFINQYMMEIVAILNRVLASGLLIELP